MRGSSKGSEEGEREGGGNCGAEKKRERFMTDGCLMVLESRITTESQNTAIETFSIRDFKTPPTPLWARIFKNLDISRKYWATRSSVRSFARTTHSFACSPYSLYLLTPELMGQ